MTETEKQDSGAVAPCNMTSGTWNLAAAGTNATTCKAACEATSIAALTVQTDTTSGAGGATTTATNAGATMAKFAAAAGAYCGAYSWTNATSQCHLLEGTGASVAADGGVASCKCAVFANVPAFASAQSAVQVAYAAVNAAAYTSLTGAADAQAALEKAWLEAWYLQQYWAALKVQLTASTVGSKSKDFYDRWDTLNGSSTSDQTTELGATASVNAASNSLGVAQGALATLQAATAASAATVAALGTRITRAGT